MKEILIALVTGSLGLLLVFAGYKFARILLPIWGFVSGFIAGSAIVADVTGTGFLATLTGFFVGLVVGVVFGLLAYLYYYAAVVILGGMLGYWIGSGVLGWFGLDTGFLTALAGLIVGVLFAVAFIFTNAPKIFLITASSFVGAVIAVGAVMLLFQVIPLEWFNYTTARVAIANSFWWTTVTFALAVIGMAFQMMTNHQEELEMWGMGDDYTPTNVHHMTHA